MNSCHNILKSVGIALLSVIPTLSVSAQYNQSISVEGKYVPEYFNIDRINTFPQQHKFTLETKPLNYDAKSVPANFQPRLISMAATGWRDTRTYSQNRGYLDLGIGSWLNSTLSAGYRFVDNKQTQVGAWLQHNSTSLWKPKMEYGDPDTKQFRYDETIGVYASHDFTGKGTLQGAASWHFGHFNYYSFASLDVLENEELSLIAPKQNLNDLSVKIGWVPVRKPDAVNWYANIGLRHFGYNNLTVMCRNSNVNKDNSIYPFRKDFSPVRETNINFDAGVLFPLSEKSAWGADVNINQFLFSKVNTDNIPDGVQFIFNPIYQPDAYFLAALKPYYQFAKDKLLVKVGADIDISSGAQNLYDKYSTFHIAPDVKLDFNASPLNFYLHLTGGSKIHSLASNYEYDYYQTPVLLSTIPVYNPLDGKLGVSFGPFSGFSAGAEFAYRVSRGEYLGGWYMGALNYGNAPIGNLPNADMVDGTLRNLNYSYISGETYNIHGYSLGLNASYDLGKILKVSGNVSYQPQNGEKGYFNGYDRARWLIDLSAESNPWSTLKFKASYNYRGVRTIYTKASYSGALNYNDKILEWLHLPDITTLNFGASYGISDNFDVWVQADNILNRHTEILPSQPQQGIRAYAGLSLKF